MTVSIRAPHTAVRSVGRLLPLALLLAVSACSGLADEPSIVSTLRPAELTAVAPLPTETPRVAVSTPVSNTANKTSATALPTMAAVATRLATQAATQAAAATQEANTVRGTVSGTVTNGTPGATVPPNLTVMLHVMTDQGPESTSQTTVDANGNYAFQDVPIRAGRGYWAMALYTDRIFGGPYVMGDPASPSLNFPLKIYEVTTDPDVISISSITIRANVTADGLEVAQVIRFTNQSDRAYTSSTSLDTNVYGSVALTVPRGASIQGFADDAGRYSISEDGAFITDTQPVLPGDKHSIHVVYTLPYRDGMTVEQPLNYPVTGNVQLLVGPETISATSQQLPSLGRQIREGESVKAYGGKLSLAAGEVLRYQLTGAVAAASVSASGSVFSRELMIGLVVGLGLGVGVLGLFFLARQRLPGGQNQADVERQDEIDDLVEQLAVLDDQHASGAISHAVYSRRRERLKRHLEQRMEG
jgi:hypothetical protein